MKRPRRKKPQALRQPASQMNSIFLMATTSRRIHKMLRKRSFHSLFGYIALLSLMLVLVGVVFEAFREAERVRQSEYTYADRSLELAAERLHTYFTLLRTQVLLASYREIELIRAIFSDPDNHDAVEQLQRRVSNELPDAFAVTLASNEGELLVADFDGLVGEICVDNIRQFADTGGEYQIRVHPNAFGYHFDVMVPVNDELAGHEGIFFVSFHLDQIAAILQDSQLPGHELMLLLEPVAGLIEIHSHGGRDAIQREHTLAEEESSRIMHARHLDGTMWKLVDLPAPGLLDEKYYQALSRYYGYILLLLMMIVSVIYTLRRETSYLGHLEEINEQLEHRVEERTAELQSANARVTAIVDNTSDAIISIDPLQNIRLFNSGAETLFGYRASEVIGHPLSQLLPPESRSAHADKVRQFSEEPTVTRPKDARAEIYGMRKDGTIFPAEASICKMDVDGEQYFTAFVRDVTERKREEERILSMAMTDALTGLANRRYFLIKLNDALAYAARYDTRLALLLIDLDNFKAVNDQHGHQVGDQLLIRVAECLREILRESDTISRLGGDEFAVIINANLTLEALGTVADKLVEGVHRIDEVDGHPVQVGATLGISLYPEHGKDADTLIANADKSLYVAKGMGKNTYHIYAGDENG